MGKEAGDTRASIIRFFTFVGGVYFFLYFVTPERLIEQLGIKEAHEPISNGFIAVGMMAIGLGLTNILMTHGSRVLFKRKGWAYSVALLIGLCVTLVVTMGQWIASRAVSDEIRKVQIVGDFATRIVADSTDATPGSEALPRSFSPSGALPALPVRVAALHSYAKQQVAELTAYRHKTREHSENDEVRATLLAELTEHSDGLGSVLLEVERCDWTVLDEERYNLLRRVAQRAAQLASSYSLIRRRDSADAVIQRSYEFVYNGLFTSLGSAMFALLGVYIAAAAYRAFRIRSLESALMMSAALIVMLGQISFGRVLYHDMPALRQWLLEVPNSAAFRAIRLGAGVAGLMLAIRMWLSIESSTFSSRKK